MSQSITPEAVQTFLVKHLEEVFSTMLSLPAVVAEKIEPGGTQERISGSVGFAGETVTGAVYLNIPSAFGAVIACAMLGMPPEETPADPDVNDVIGEVTNMLAGGLKSWLCDAGATCALTTPAIIRGTSFHVLAGEGVQRVRFGFASNTHQGQVEVHIKLAN